MSAADRTKDNVEQAKETTQRNFIAATDSITNGINRGIDSTANAYGQTKDSAEKAYEQTKDSAEKAYDETKDTVEKNAEQAKEVADRNIEQAKQNAEKAKKTVLQKLEDDGVVNPKGLAMIGFSGLFFAAIPVSSWIAQPNSLLEKAVNGVCSSVAYLGSAGATSRVPQTGKIAALGALYVAVTYGITGAASVAGVTAASDEGRDNRYPRKNVNSLTGLPLRLYSAHYNLLEMFPSWAIAAALTQAIAPADTHLINLLGLHVLSKVFLYESPIQLTRPSRSRYYPSYLFNVAETRSLAHVIATGSVIGVLSRLIQKPLL